MSEEGEQQVCTFFKKRRNNAQIRGSSAKKADSDDENPPAAKKQPPTRKPNSDSDEENDVSPKPEKQPDKTDSEPENNAKSEDDDDDDNSDTDLTENLAEMKRKYGRNSKQSSLTQSSKQGKSSKEDVVTKFSANRDATRTGPNDMGATAVFNLDTEFDRDARAVMERAQKINDDLKASVNDDKVYRGMNNYQQFIKPRETAQGKAFNPKGPMRAPTNLRVNFKRFSFFV